MMKASRKRALVLVGALSLVAIVLAGCIKITYLNIPTGIPAGSNYTITMQASPTIDLNDVAPTLAFRIPNAWEVKTVVLSGAISRQMIYSPTMATYFSTTWEAKPVDISHNGAKPGYKWWAGYATQADVHKDDVITASITIDTHGAAGTFSLDFVTGMTDPTGYENQTLNANGSNWESGGVLTPPGVKLDQITTLTAAGPTFLDVPVGHPYFDAIEGMAAAAIINGYDVPGGKEFRPDNDVVRWQFAKMICGALAIPVNEGLVSTFPDLGADNPASLEPHDYVAAATNNNIIKGYGDGTFRAYTTISRAQVVTMVVRGMKTLKPGVLQAPPAGYTSTLGNFDTGEHSENMRWADFNGLLTGVVGFQAGWDPWAKMSRGEVAQVLWNTMALLP
jgi:hypothetical protein